MHDTNNTFLLEYTREKIAALITSRLQGDKQRLMEQFLTSKNQIGYFVIDELLPEELALKIHEIFPTTEEAVLKRDLREYKYVAYQMNAYHALLEEVIYAFQDKKVVKLIEEICQLKNILPDTSLYAGGLSMMRKGNFLNPHLDNSHDHDRNNWRVLNLLYYVTPNWKESYGGNLEIWSKGLKKEPTTIVSRFNRLVVMSTHKNSWHSVNKVVIDQTRCCVSNYYFSNTPIFENEAFHVTSFRGRPGQRFKNVLLKIDTNLRTTLRKFFVKGIRENPHRYKK